MRLTVSSEGRWGPGGGCVCRKELVLGSYALQTTFIYTETISYLRVEKGSWENFTADGGKTRVPYLLFFSILKERPSLNLGSPSALNFASRGDRVIKADSHQVLNLRNY